MTHDNDDDDDEQEEHKDVCSTTTTEMGYRMDDNIKRYHPRVYSDDEVVAADHLASCIMTPIEMDVWASIKNIKDPEYPMWTLSQLRICYPTGVCVKDDTMMIEFTPTVEHCSLATLIGLCIRSKLLNDFGNSWKIVVYIKDGTHDDSKAISKQLNDKERCSAAMENPQLLELVQTAICDTEWAY